MPSAKRQKLIVVGGQASKVGKTSVAAGVMAALPEFHWTALKITQDRHGVCSANGEACDCATADHSWAISEEKDRSGKSDTSRFLVAGATHAWWVRTQPGRLADALPRIRAILAASENAIIESNSIMSFLDPDLYLVVLDPQTADFKASAQAFLDRADAVLIRGSADSSKPVWKRVSLTSIASRPTFAIHPPRYVTSEIVAFVRSRLTARPVPE